MRTLVSEHAQQREKDKDGDQAGGPENGGRDEGAAPDIAGLRQADAREREQAGQAEERAQAKRLSGGDEMVQRGRHAEPGGGEHDSPPPPVARCDGAEER